MSWWTGARRKRLRRRCGAADATGFLRNAADDTDNNELNIALIRYRVLQLTIQNVTSNVLGLTVGCAQCHTHKYDPIPQRDYYRMMAIFMPAYNPQSWPQNQGPLPAGCFSRREGRDRPPQRRAGQTAQAAARSTDGHSQAVRAETARQEAAGYSGSSARRYEGRPEHAGRKAQRHRKVSGEEAGSASSRVSVDEAKSDAERRGSGKVRGHRRSDSSDRSAAAILRKDPGAV